MREISGDYAQAFLRAAWDAAPDGAQTFKDYLTAFLNLKVKETASGRMVQSTSSAGNAVSFYIPPTASATDIITPVTLIKLVNEVLRLYEQATAAGVTDEQEIFGLILACYDPKQEAYSDFTQLRVSSGVAWT